MPLQCSLVSEWQDWGPDLKPVDWGKVHREPFVRTFYMPPAQAAAPLQTTAGAGAARGVSRLCALGGPRALRNLRRLRSAKRRRGEGEAPRLRPCRKTLWTASRLKRRFRPAAGRGCGPLQSADLAREAIQIRVEEDPFGDCPRPVASFGELGVLPEFVVRGLREHGILSPMPIQQQALPLVLSGRNVIGLAQTGSGKTLAFLLPAAVHAEAQPLVASGQGPATPIVLVLAPTRELAVQIAEEAGKVLGHSGQGKHPGGLRSACVFGGVDKAQQKRSLWWGAHILVATPGRLIDFVSSGVVSLKRVTYLVLDEADRMLDMGFQGDVAAISGQVRPERQVLFFSATWNKAVQDLAMGLCQDGSRPVRISYGESGSADPEGDGASARRARDGITQEVVVIDEAPGDWDKQAATKRTLLVAHLRRVLGGSGEHKVLVFVSQKNLADDLAAELKKDGFEADAMHGGKSQEYRLWVLDQFRKDKLRLLVCTDVLGRGIDIPSVSHVVVHEMGTVEDYIHRIGRTARGRNGRGHALVFFEYWDREPRIAEELVEVLEASGQRVPPELLRIADDVALGRRKDAPAYRAAPAPAVWERVSWERKK